MTKRIITTLTILSLLSHGSYGQGFDRSLYVSVDILSVKPHPTGERPYNEFYKIESNLISNKRQAKGLTAIISDSTIKDRYYDKSLLIGYFFNHTGDTLLIDRCDDAILKTETQVFANNRWVTFQLNMPSDCGLSYYSTKLPPKSYYILQIPEPTDGDIETRFRIKFTYDKTTIYSNSVTVKLTKERLAKTKQKIKPYPWN